MKKIMILFAICANLFYLSAQQPVFASSDPSKTTQPKEELTEIIVSEQRLSCPTKETGETVFTGTQLTKEGMKLSGEKGTSSVWETISVLPGVIFEGIDPSNLSSEQANIRIRGVKGYLGGLTVAGIPNYGGNPIGPRAYIYDLENFESISLYQGAVPANLGAGVGNRGGLIELSPKWASKSSEVQIKTVYGSFDYIKGYARVDTGELGPISTRSSIAYSYTKSDKWKGPGDLGPRHNINLTLVQPLGEKIEFKFLVNYNDIEYDLYRYLSYDQTKNLSNYRRLDYNEKLTGDPSTDWLYYKFNRAEHQNSDFMGIVNYNFTKNIKINLKGYYLDEDAEIWSGSPKIQGKPGVQKRTRDIDKQGIIPELSFLSNKINIVLGSQYEIADMQISAENYWIDDITDNLTYRGYGILATTGKTYITSPYGKIAGSFGNINWQAGLKYFRFKDADSTGYVSQIINNEHVLVRAEDLDRKGRTYDIWLPSGGLSYRINPDLELYTSYGKNFIRPYAYMPIIKTYNLYREKFQTAGVTLNQLFEGYDIERSDTLDFGIRFKHELIDINPTFFYSKHKKLLTVISDPRIIVSGKPVTYRQNIGEATGYGLQMNINIRPIKGLTFFINPTYNHLTYDKDIYYAGNKLDAEGKQVLDVPKWSLVTGAIWNYNGFNVIPIIKYEGERFGDVQHNERIPSYVVCDLKVSYERKKFFIFKEFNVGLEVNNIFDKKYISLINALDDAVTGTSYGVGSPFAIKTFVSFKF